MVFPQLGFHAHHHEMIVLQVTVKNYSHSAQASVAAESQKPETSESGEVQSCMFPKQKLSIATATASHPPVNCIHLKLPPETLINTYMFLQAKEKGKEGPIYRRRISFFNYVSCYKFIHSQSSPENLPQNHFFKSRKK